MRWGPDAACLSRARQTRQVCDYELCVHCNAVEFRQRTKISEKHTVAGATIASKSQGRLSPKKPITSFALPVMPASKNASQKPCREALINRDTLTPSNRYTKSSARQLIEPSTALMAKLTAFNP